MSVREAGELVKLDWLKEPWTWEQALPIWATDDLDRIKDMVVLTCMSMYDGRYRMSARSWVKGDSHSLKPLSLELEQLAKERGWK